MKPKTLNQILIFVIAFVMSFAVTYNYSSSIVGHKIQDVIGMILFFFITIGALKYYKDKLKPCIVFIWILLGCLIFLLPYSLTHLPWQTILIAGLVNIIIGIISGYLFYIYKYTAIRIIIIIIAILYAILHVCFIFDYIWNNFVVII